MDSSAASDGGSESVQIDMPVETSSSASDGGSESARSDTTALMGAPMHSFFRTLCGGSEGVLFDFVPSTTAVLDAWSLNSDDPSECEALGKALVAICSACDDSLDSAQFESAFRKVDRKTWLRNPHIDLNINFVLGKDNEAYLEFSGNAPLVSHQPIAGRRMRMSDFRRLLGLSDAQYDSDTAAHRSTLRANLPHEPERPTDIDTPRDRIEARMMPGKPQCYHSAHLLGLTASLHPKLAYSLSHMFELDHDDQFTVYKVAVTGKWSLLHALITALTIRYPSLELSALDLYYHYKKHAPTKSFSKSTATCVPVNVAAHNYEFISEMAVHAMNDYMRGFGLDHYHVLVVIQPGGEQTFPRFTSCPGSVMYCALHGTQSERIWLMCTKNEEAQPFHYNVVMRHPTEMSPSLMHALDKLESQQTMEYGSRIRLLEADLMDRNVPMTSLTREETRKLFHETAAERFEHMNRPDFISKSIQAKK